MGVKVRENPKGSGEWWIFINHKGKRRSKKIGNDKNKALEVAEKVKAKLVLNELKVEKINEKCPTFKEYAEMWVALPNERKESTNNNYKSSLKKRIMPYIGDCRINDISRKDIKLMFDKLLIEGIKHNTFPNIKAPLNGVLNHAVDSEIIEVNPARDIKIKRRVFYIVDPLTEDEAHNLLDELKQHESGTFFPPAQCLIRTGMRIGELQALTWSDIDFTKRLININKSFRARRLTETKNRRTRRVDMTPHLAETLLHLKERQWKKWAKSGQDIPQWVFAGKKGNILRRGTFRDALHSCLEKLGLKKVRIHDLRHTYATTRLLMGHNIGDVAYQLGHSDVSITFKEYAHWIPGKFKSEVDELDKSHVNARYTHVKNKAAHIN